MQGGIATVILAYAPQAGLQHEQMDHSYDRPQQRRVPTITSLWLASSMDMLESSLVFSSVHGEHRFGSRNKEGARPLECCDANMLLIGNTNFKKPVSHLVIYQSSNFTSHTDYILIRQRDVWLLLNITTLPGEECTLQHRLIVSNFISQG